MLRPDASWTFGCGVSVGVDVEDAVVRICRDVEVDFVVAVGIGIPVVVDLEVEVSVEERLEAYGENRGGAAESPAGWAPRDAVSVLRLVVAGDEVEVEAFAEGTGLEVFVFGMAASSAITAARAPGGGNADEVQADAEADDCVTDAFAGEEDGAGPLAGDIFASSAASDPAGGRGA